jgi:hypothetical protein
VFVVPNLSLAPGSGIFDSEIILTVKKQGELVAKRTIPITGGLLPPLCAMVFPLDVTEDDVLFFDYSTRDARDLTDPFPDPPIYDPALIEKLVDKSVDISPLGCPFLLFLTTVPSAFHNADLPDALTEAHRGWSVVGYNGNRDRATMPIDETAFVDFMAKIAKAAGYSFDSSLAFPQLPFPVLDRWQAQDEFCWLADDSVSSSRMGVDFVSVPGSGLAGARAVPRISNGEQTSVEFGISVASASITLPGAASRGELDFIDMNADRFPDVLGRDRVQYSTMTGGLEATNRPVSGLSPLRTSSNEAANGGVGFGVGGNPANSKQDSKGNVNPSGTRSSSTGEQGSQMPELGFSAEVGVGSSQSEHDLIDLNGDSLADRVAIAGGQLFVSFNLGYGFAPQELWGIGQINSGESSSFNLGASLGFNDLIYGFGGGASLVRSDATTNETLADINGDGLTDCAPTEARSWLR